MVSPTKGPGMDPNNKRLKGENAAPEHPPYMRGGGGGGYGMYMGQQGPPPPHQFMGGPPPPQYGGPPPGYNTGAPPPPPPPHSVMYRSGMSPDRGPPPPGYPGGGPFRGGGGPPPPPGAMKRPGDKPDGHHDHHGPPPPGYWNHPGAPYPPPGQYGPGGPGGPPPSYPMYSSQGTWTGKTPPRPGGPSLSGGGGASVGGPPLAPPHFANGRPDIDMSLVSSHGNGSVNRPSGMSNADMDDGTSSSMGSHKHSQHNRGSYKCGRCGVPKKGHVCPYQPKLKRRPDEPPPVMKTAACQVEMDEFMTLRRLNLRMQGLPESYATEPYSEAGSMMLAVSEPPLPNHGPPAPPQQPPPPPPLSHLHAYPHPHLHPNNGGGSGGGAPMAPRHGRDMMDPANMRAPQQHRPAAAIPAVPGAAAVGGVGVPPDANVENRTNAATNDDNEAEEKKSEDQEPARAG